MPHPDIGIPQYGIPEEAGKVYYRYDYEGIFRDIAGGVLQEPSTYRELVLTDLWFIVYFVMGIPIANHPFVVKRCREVEKGPDDFTLDIWAREHLKSSIITIAETIQCLMKDPESPSAIFSYARPPAKRFLFEIKRTLEESVLLKASFPDVVWQDPQKESPLWSLDEGLLLKRKSNRKEPSISGWGLIEGMPTGLHFPRRIYDDIVTEDIGQSIDVMEKVKDKFDSSQNLGTDGGTHRVIGTYYHHNDPLVYIRDKKVYGTENRRYKLRLYPATHNGEYTGDTVFLSQKKLDQLKGDRSFNCQQLLDPTPAGIRELDSSYLKEIDPEDIPHDIYKFMMIDPAGDDKNGMGDAWGILCVGVEPKADDIGASNIYILDAVITPLREKVAPDEIVRMYIRNGSILQLGVEKVGQSTAEIHVANALDKRDRHISVENGTLVILRPAGRKKMKRIASALAWPLDNGKIHISTSVPFAYRERLKLEMDKFPSWHDDGLDALSYLYDMIKDFHFASYFDYDIPEYEPVSENIGY